MSHFFSSSFHENFFSQGEQMKILVGRTWTDCVLWKTNTVCFFFLFFFLNLHLVVLHRPTVLSNQNFFFPKTKLPKGKACAWHIPSKFRVSTFDATTTLPYGASIRLDVLHPSANDVSWTVSYEDKRKLRARRDAWKYGGTAFICRTRRFHARKGSAMPASLKPFKNIQRPKRMAQHGETTEIESRTGRSRHLASSFLS